MKNLDFKYAFAKNFLCFGREGIELDFTKYGNVILIKGRNLDRQDINANADDEKKKISSNGSGKSSIPEIMVYTLFGKTIKTPKKITHGDVINNKANKKDLLTEVRWGNYRVVRTRKPDSLRIWESENGDWSGLGDEEWEKEREISKGGIPATQRLVEERLGFNYETFTNIAVFTDNNAGAFLELDAASKREIIENLLSLDNFREYFDTAKKERNRIKNEVKIQGELYQYAIQSLEKAKDRVAQLHQKNISWKREREIELARLSKLIENKTKELTVSDSGLALVEYNNAQDSIERLNQQSNDLIVKDSKVKEILAKTRDSLDEDRVLLEKASIDISTFSHEAIEHQACIKRNKALIAPLQSLEDGARCPTCFGEIHKENYADVLIKAEIDMNVCVKSLEDITAAKEKLHKEYEEISKRIIRYRDTIKLGDVKSADFSKQLISIRQQIGSLSKVSKPDSSTYEKIIEQQLNALKKEEESKKLEINNPSPFMELITTAETEVRNEEEGCKNKKNELEALEKEIPYYEFFVDAFSEEGIRKFVIAGILPSLNSRIAYWLQFLIDSKIKLSFDQELEEIIERNPSDGDPFVYHAMSGGERRMLNLSVSQAFAYIMMLSSGASISCAFLDEVTTNIDQIGVQGVYNMIMELSREKQVFVTTHDHDLLDMLSGYDTVELQKKDGFTTLIS